jgi:hypothetical protein
MQPIQKPVTDPIGTPGTTSRMVPSRAAIERLTPGSVLRAAAGYLHQFGWWQGDLFDDPDRSTPCACPVGAIRMAVVGTPDVAVEHLRADVLAVFNAAVAVLADHLISQHDQPAPVAPYGVLFPGDLEQVVARWNDHPDRNVGQVLAALHGAADEWDRIHTTTDLSDSYELDLVEQGGACGLCGAPGGAPYCNGCTEPAQESTHADYPHRPGALYDCPACETVCFCDEGFQCVSCAGAADPGTFLGGGA